MNIAVRQLPGNPTAWQIEGQRLGEKMTLEVSGGTEQVTNALVWLWTRKADRYVSTIMRFVADLRNGAMSCYLDQCAMLVCALDGVGKDLSLPEAAQAIRTTVPVFRFLRGKESWSGHAERNAEYLELVALAAAINARIGHNGPTCSKCLAPLEDQHQCLA